MIRRLLISACVLGLIFSACTAKTVSRAQYEKDQREGDALLKDLHALEQDTSFNKKKNIEVRL